jgi:hypothetical protein
MRIDSNSAVIASEAKQSRSLPEALDCFGGFAASQ